MTHLILNGDDLDNWVKHHTGGLLIPADRRPTVLQKDREAAERECLRLAREHSGGLFVLFAPVALAKRLPEASHVNLRGEVLRTSNVARLLPIAGSPGHEDWDIPF
jgi:hypothetical protein